MKLVADARGRLAAIHYFRPGKAFDVTPQSDGSLRIIELVEREVPVVKVKFKADGTFECPRLMNREQILDYIRAERDTQ
ncbi:MAG: hypothetical protein ACREFE_04030 [Limisphaerales bacterium]